MSGNDNRPAGDIPRFDDSQNYGPGCRESKGRGGGQPGGAQPQPQAKRRVSSNMQDQNQRSKRARPNGSLARIALPFFSKLNPALQAELSSQITQYTRRIGVYAASHHTFTAEQMIELLPLLGTCADIIYQNGKQTPSAGVATSVTQGQQNINRELVLALSHKHHQAMMEVNKDTNQTFLQANKDTHQSQAAMLKQIFDHDATKSAMETARNTEMIKFFAQMAQGTQQVALQLCAVSAAKYKLIQTGNYLHDALKEENQYAGTITSRLRIKDGPMVVKTPVVSRENEHRKQLGLAIQAILSKSNDQAAKKIRDSVGPQTQLTAPSSLWKQIEPTPEDSSELEQHLASIHGENVGDMLVHHDDVRSTFFGQVVNQCINHSSTETDGFPELAVERDLLALQLRTFTAVSNAFRERIAAESNMETNTWEIELYIQFYRIMITFLEIAAADIEPVQKQACTALERAANAPEIEKLRKMVTKCWDVWNVSFRYGLIRLVQKTAELYKTNKQSIAEENIFFETPAERIKHVQDSDYQALQTEVRSIMEAISRSEDLEQLGADLTWEEAHVQLGVTKIEHVDVRRYIQGTAALEPEVFQGWGPDLEEISGNMVGMDIDDTMDCVEGEVK